MKWIKRGGFGWRREITKELQKMEIIVFDPTNKPYIKDLHENKFLQRRFKKLRKEGRFIEIVPLMKEIRNYDLALVDKSDAIIFYYDKNIQTCGSWEELFLANSEKKPIFFICKQGIKQLPLWMLAVLPLKYFYKSIKDCVKVLRDINEGKKEIDSERWRLLKYEFR